MPFLTSVIKKTIVPVVLAAALLLVNLHNVATTFRQSSVWTGPYLSAAANLSWPPAFLIDLEDINQFNHLDDPTLEDQYQFKASGPLTPYAYNDIGYVYLIWFAKGMFPFLGHQQSILLLQALLHLVLCTLLVNDRAFSNSWRLGFLILYALNPIVLKYVVFNHYYFWQSVPSLLIVLLAGKSTRNTGTYVLIAFLPWAVLARTTTLLVVPVILYLLYKNRGRATLLTTLTYCTAVGFFFFKPSQKNMWHTAYIGTGAYANPYGINLSDNDGYDLYQKSYGEPLSATTGGNLYDPAVFSEYKALTQKAFLENFALTPGLYLKNAMVNSAGAYSVGYLSGKPDWINYLLAGLGLLVIILFVQSRQWVYLISMGLLAFSYTLYYPPIPAYLFGNYALLIAGLLGGIHYIRQRQKADDILYLSFNDGSDMRINKELRTLSKAARVELVALGPDRAQCFADSFVHTLHFIEGPRKSKATLLRYFFRCAYLLLRKKYHSVHIINEPQLLALWPFVWFQNRVVLDLFDSIFLRKNKPGNQWYWVKKLTYAPIDELLVTDENRVGLLPDYLQKRAYILPNYPDQIDNLPAKSRAPHLTIMYYGWLGELRGTQTIRGLLDADPDLRVLMAGWIADETSCTLTQHPRVEWLGILPQAEALRRVAIRADYILCVYAPVNDNNINASPNKIYDAMLTRTPVIMNAEVKVSEFVRNHQLGYVLSGYLPDSYILLAKELKTKRELYTFDPLFCQNYTWEKVEDVLFKAHRLP